RTLVDEVRPAGRIAGGIGENPVEAPVASERTAHPVDVQEPTVFAERQVPHAVQSKIVGLVGVVKLVNRRLLINPVVQAMVLLVGFRESVGEAPGQDPATTAIATNRSLFDLDLESVRAILT